MQNPNAKHRQTGTVLLDALIAIVIFSIGILGMVKLQGQAVSAAGQAKYRTDAALLADQIIARMWGSNPAQLATNFKGTSGTGPQGYTDWNSAVANALPNGKGTIDVDTSNFVVVTVAWQTKDSADQPVHTYVSRTQITR